MKRPGNVRGYIEDERDVYHRYVVLLESMQSIAARYQVTRQAVWHCLKRQGADTSKRGAAHIEVKCTWCKKPVMKRRYDVRKNRHNFCGEICYHAWLDRGEWSGRRYLDDRRGRRIAREIVAGYIELLPGYVVHHEDRDCTNNELSNLRVFASAGEHVQYHRGVLVEPIWDGRRAG